MMNGRSKSKSALRIIHTSNIIVGGCARRVGPIAVTVCVSTVKEREHPDPRALAGGVSSYTARDIRRYANKNVAHQRFVVESLLLFKQGDRRKCWLNRLLIRSQYELGEFIRYHFVSSAD